jgi:hypothetical protein
VDVCRRACAKAAGSARPQRGPRQAAPCRPCERPWGWTKGKKARERRGPRLVRDADESHLDGRSLRARARVMERLTRCIPTRLTRVVNEAKRAVAGAWERQRLGFRLTRHRAPKRRRAPPAVKRFKQRMRTLTPRTREAGTAPLAGVTHPRCWAGVTCGVAAADAARCGSRGGGQAIGHDAAAASAERLPGTPPHLHTDPGVSVRARR